MASYSLFVRPFESDFVTLRQLEGTPVILMTRTTVALGHSEAELRRFYEGVAAVFDRLPTHAMDLLVDARDAPGRNDALFEQVQAEYRDRIFGRFRRTAVVIATPAGKLQVARYEQEAEVETPYLVFASVEEAKARLEALSAAVG